MKKNVCYVLCGCAMLLLIGLSTFASPFISQAAVNRQVTRQVTQADYNQQIALFVKQLARQDPAQFATLLLGRKMHYVSNPSVVYIGIKGGEEGLVICKVEDSDVGTFFHAIRKQGSKYVTDDLVSFPSTQEFITLFEAK